MTKSLDYYSNKIRFNIERIKIEISYLKHRSNSYMVKQKENGFITTLRSPESDASEQIVADSASQFDGFSLNENAEVQSIPEDIVKLSVPESNSVYNQERERVLSNHIYSEEQLKLHVSKTRNSHTESLLKKRQSYTSSNYSYENIWNSGADNKVKTPEPYRRISNNIFPIIKKTGLKLLKIEPLPIKDPAEIEELEEICSGVNKLEVKSSFSNDTIRRTEYFQNDLQKNNPIELRVSEKTDEKYIINPMSLTAARISIEKRVSSNIIKEASKTIERMRLGSSTSSKGTTEKIEEQQESEIEIRDKKFEHETINFTLTTDEISSSAKHNFKSTVATSETGNQKAEQELTESIKKNNDSSNKNIGDIKDNTKVKEVSMVAHISDFASVRKISVRSLNSDFMNNTFTNSVLKNTVIKSRPNTRASMDRTFESYGDLISDYANESFKENDV